jgi:hypothetical protein
LRYALAGRNSIPAGNVEGRHTAFLDCRHIIQE